MFASKDVDLCRHRHRRDELDLWELHLRYAGECLLLDPGRHLIAIDMLEIPVLLCPRYNGQLRDLCFLEHCEHRCSRHYCPQNHCQNCILHHCHCPYLPPSSFEA